MRGEFRCKRLILGSLLLGYWGWTAALLWGVVAIKDPVMEPLHQLLAVVLTFVYSLYVLLLVYTKRPPSGCFGTLMGFALLLLCMLRG